MSLTAEDKQWFTGQLDTKFEVLATDFDGKLERLAIGFDIKLGQMEARFDARLERLETGVDGKLEQLETRFDAKLEQLETRFDAKLEQLETRFDAKLERVETTLLTEFQKWASPHEARIRTHSATLRAIDLELEAVSDRVPNSKTSGPSEHRGAKLPIMYIMSNLSGRTPKPPN